MRRPTRDWTVIGAILLAVLLTLGLLNSSGGRPNLNYLIGVLLIIEIYALFALGLSLQFGYTGLLNFGHVASMAIGAYAVAILVPRLQRAGYAETISAGGAAGVLACLLIAVLLFLLFALLLGRAARTKAAAKLPARVRALAPPIAAGILALLLGVAAYPLDARGAVGVLVLTAMVVGMVVAGLWGLLLGLPAVRLREDYLAIVTIGAAEILKGITVNEEWLTNGTLGIQSVERPVAEWARRTGWWRSLANALDVQPTVLAHAGAGLLLLLVAFLLLQVLARSPWGRVLKAIREDEVAAAALGKNVQLYKLQVLMLGSALGAVAGVLFAWNLSNVYPEHFLSIVTFYAFIILIIGGVGDHRGALVGAILLWGVFELAGSITLLSDLGFTDLAGPPQGIAIGLLLVLVMMFRPQGALGRKQEMLFVR